MDGGLSVPVWLEMWYATHAGNGLGGVVRVEWPIGGAYWEQPALSVAVLALVGDEALKEMESNRGGSANSH